MVHFQKFVEWECEPEKWITVLVRTKEGKIYRAFRRAGYYPVPGTWENHHWYSIEGTQDGLWSTEIKEWSYI